MKKHTNDSSLTDLHSNPSNAVVNISSCKSETAELNDVFHNDLIDVTENEHLVKAVSDSIQAGSFLPILKQELKYKIQHKRLSSGLSELEVQPNVPPKYLLRVEEVRKRNRRLQQNRSSAIRCRIRFREYKEQLLQEIQSAERKRIELEDTIVALGKEKDMLKALIQLHMDTCGKRIPNNVKPKTQKYVSILNSRWRTNCLVK